MRSVDAGSENASGGETTLLDWMNRQYALSAAAMLRAVSATDLVKERRGFGQTINPAWSVLASPEIASYDPDPDYFFTGCAISRLSWTPCGR